MFSFRLVGWKKRFLYYIAMWFFIVLILWIVIHGLNLVAERMSAMVPGLPIQVFSWQLMSENVQVGIFDKVYTFPIPEVLQRSLQDF